MENSQIILWPCAYNANNSVRLFGLNVFLECERFKEDHTENTSNRKLAEKLCTSAKALHSGLSHRIDLLVDP